MKIKASKAKRINQIVKKPKKIIRMKINYFLALKNVVKNQKINNIIK